MLEAVQIRENMHFAYRALAHNRQNGHAPYAALCEASIRSMVTRLRELGYQPDGLNELSASIHQTAVVQS